MFIASGSTCRKEQIREYYTENDCRSRQPLKYARCVGGCGNQCCSAKVVRRRKVCAKKDSLNNFNSLLHILSLFML